jgi:IPT/TIG domain
MKVLRQRKYLFALLALLVVFAACKGESPTAPTPTGGTSGGGTSGGTTPPVGATITLTVSNASPLVNSTSVVTATVSANGNPVPNGTAVEFDTTLGTWTDTVSTVTIRTTTNGVATATLTSPSAGTAKVTAIVNNVSKTTNIVFQAATTPPTNTPTAPTVTGVAPATGLATGGETITITGTNFRAPVRVLFDFGAGVVKEGFVASVTPTQLTVVTPKVDLGAGQTLAATIIVITEAGTTTEARVSASAPFTFRLAQLTPVITTVSPDSGGIEGGTRITIFGSGFEAPAQVSFGTGGTFNQMQVISITFNQIIALTPTARDVNPNGSGPLTGPVDLRVLNINSNTFVVLSNAFRYTPKAQITTIAPGEGPFTGGTRMTIDGTGFDDPVAVTVAGVAAQVIKVSGTQLIVVTSGVQPTGCTDITGPVLVVNVNNGDGATGPNFIYRVPKPIILSVTNPTPLGGNICITVLNALGVPRLKIGDVGLSITSTTINADGSTTFCGPVPNSLTLATKACQGVAGVTTPINTFFDVTYTSALTTCTDTLTKGAEISPPSAANLTVSPIAGFTPFIATITPATVGPPATLATVKASAAQTIQLVNNGTAPLTINSVNSAGCPGANFTVVAPVTPATLNQCDSAPIIVVFNGSTTPGTTTCTVTVNTSAGNQTFTLLGTSQ